MHGNRSFTSARDDRIQIDFVDAFFNIIVETCPQPSETHTSRLSRASEKKRANEKLAREDARSMLSLSLAQHRLREKHSTQTKRKVL